jgi:hypothetical protein
MMLTRINFSNLRLMSLNQKHHKKNEVQFLVNQMLKDEI